MSKSKKSLASTVVQSPQPKVEVDDQPLDVLTVKIMSLRLPDDDPRPYSLKVMFYDQILIANAIILPMFARSKEKEHVIAEGYFYYASSDYELMSLMANSPLVVHVQPKENIQQSSSSITIDSKESFEELSCCNIDILQMFTTLDEMCVKKRMEPALTPSALEMKSWDNLPLITMKLSVDRNELNETHHKLLEDANTMKFTVAGVYNLMMPYRDDITYEIHTLLPVYPAQNPEKDDASVMVFNGVKEQPRRFDCTNFYPIWETERQNGTLFNKSDEKISTKFEDIVNDSNIDLEYYLHKRRDTNVVVWESFYRTMVLGMTQRAVRKQIRRFKWALELHLRVTSNPEYGYSFMAFFNLFRLLYPGERRLFMAVPLEWHNEEAMENNCKWPLFQEALKTPPLSTGKEFDRSSSLNGPLSTGADDNPAFILLEITMGQPLIKEHIPPYFSGEELLDMLKKMEQSHIKRHCTGRGQSDRDWKATVSQAVSALRRVPHHGLTEYCIFNRQLSETRTRVEIFNSFWMSGAVYINNNFVIQDFLDDDQKFEELLMIGHIMLMRIANAHLVGPDTWLNSKTTLRAARQARHLQDIGHATELYMQEAASGAHCESVWRELGTCLRDVDHDWAAVCIDKAFLLDTRHPLSLLSKASMVYEDDPDGAELFFRALIYLYPFWGTAWVITSAYFHSRELFSMADSVMKYYRLTLAEQLQQNPPLPRTWDHELGDWWDSPPLLPGMSPYYDAADILLRLRAISLAEVCISLALTSEGESAIYYHMVGLCCRLRGRIEDALCHVRQGISNHGEVNYLRSLEGECLHLLEDKKGAMAAFDKAGANQGPYSILISLPRWQRLRIRPVLVDLLRRQPNAYAWMALANDWMTRAEAGEETSSGSGQSDLQTTAHACATACAVQALNWDRRASRAWALLAKLAKPNTARVHYFKMAAMCGYRWMEPVQQPSESTCPRLGRALNQCRCMLCDTVRA